MKRVSAILLALVLFGLTVPAQAAETAPTTVVMTAVNAWLALVDGGHYDESWDKASRVFQNVVPKSQWIQALTGTRKPLGPVVWRNVRSLVTKTRLPGVPDGSYIILTYDTRFGKQNLTESVTFAKDPDGVWRAAGYYIR